MPPPEVRDLRDLTRFRKTLVQDRSSQVNRVAKILELANVKLGSVVSNIMGVTSRAIPEAMIAKEDGCTGSDGVDAPSRRHRDVPRWY